MGLGTIDTELDALFEGDPTALSGVEVCDVLEVADRVRTRIDAFTTDLLASLADSRAYRADGAYSTANWLTQTTGTSKADAGRRTRLAEHLDSLPTAAGLFRDGLITAEHVRVLARAVANPRTRDAFDDFEEWKLALFARFHRVDQLATRVARWIDVHDDDGTPPDDPSTDQTFAAQVGDRIIIKADLSLATGLPILSALEEATDKVFHADQAHGEDHVWSTRRRRARSNQRSEALAGLIGAGAAAPANTSRREPAFVVIEREHPDDESSYEMPDGTLIPRRLARKWATGAAMLRLMLRDDTGSRFTDRHGNKVEHLDRGRSARLANRAQRRGLACRDRGCTFPGCDRAAAWTDAHHVTWWRNQGHTDLHNLTLLCRFHHGEVHAGRYVLSMGPGQTPVFTTPAGEAVITRRQRPPPDLADTRAA